MSLSRLLLRLICGRRLPITSGELRVPGLGGAVAIRRDRWGVPHIEATSDADAWFALGFCHGQDRGGQLELLRREGEPFRRAAADRFAPLAAKEQQAIADYANGVNAGTTLGLPKPPHEFAILGGQPSIWEPADVLSVSALRSEDSASRRNGVALHGWFIDGTRTASLKPLLACNPHGTPTAPPPWYVAHLRTPDWEVLGATLVGSPAFLIGHDGATAWGIAERPAPVAYALAAVACASGSDAHDDSDRTAVIRDEIEKRSAWDVPGCGDLQMNARSMRWERMRDAVLALNADDADARDALDLLREWDGRVEADSAAATVFELFVADAEANSPVDWPAALGGAVRRLRRDFGPGPGFWVWGNVRPLLLRHPQFGTSRWHEASFNLGPVSIGGDAHTINPAGGDESDPTGPVRSIAGLRAVFDLEDLSKSTFVLCGGQSGNPFSLHFADQLHIWQEGGTICVPWEPPRVLRETRDTLRLWAR